MRETIFADPLKAGDSILMAKGDKWELGWSPPKNLLARIVRAFRNAPERVVLEVVEINVGEGTPMARLSVVEVVI